MTGAASGVAAGTATWSAAGIALQPGANVLTITARDAAGNTGSDVLTVTYAPDTTGPTVVITTPTTETTYTAPASPLTMGGTAADNVGVTQVTWSNDRGGSGTATGTTTWSAAGIVLQAGANVLTVTARDAAGNTATDLLTVTYSPSTIPGLVAAWGFNEGAGTTTADASGNNNTGVISGATWTTQGRYGSALSFNGTSNMVVVANSASLNLTTAMTLSAWVMPTANQTGWRTILFREQDVYFLTAGTSSGNRRPTGGGTFNGTMNYISGPTAVPLNVWTHVALTWDGAQLRVYANGAQVATAARGGVLESVTTTLQIGGNVPYGEFFLGRLDEIRIYNRALSQAEVQADGATPVGTPPTPDTTAPTVVITTPTTETTYTAPASPLTLTGTAADNVGVTQVTWSNDRGGSGTAAGTTAWTASGIALQAGANVLTVTARDAAGNTATDVLTVTYTPSGGDTTPPTVVITTPAAIVSPLTLTGTAADNVGVTQVTWSNDRGGSGSATGMTTWSAAGIVLQAGVNVLTVTARDAAGNTGSRTVSLTYASSGDTTPPTVAIIAPAANATVASTITVTATASDDTGVAGVQFFIDGVALGAEVTAPPYSRQWNTTTVVPGPHVVTARARDAAGNMTTSSPVPVTVTSTTASAIGQWSGVSSWPLVAVHATLLPNGRLLVWDGADQNGRAYVWNPSTNVFTLASQPDNIFCAGQTLLADGRVFVAGGHFANFEGIRDANVFSPTTGTWSALPSMTQGRWYPTVITLPDGRALVVSGEVDCYRCSAEIPEIYNPATNQWTALNAAALALPEYPHLFVLPDGRVLLTSAFDDPTVTRTLNVGTQTWTVVDPVARDAHSAAMYRLGRIVKSGTSANSDPPYFSSSPNTYVLDMNLPSPAWRQTAPMAFGRAYHNLTLLPDGNVLATGGGRNTDPYASSQAVFPAELWSPESETWTTMAANQVPRLYHSTALLLPDGRVLLAGGGRFGGGATEDQLTAEFYSPPYLFKGARPVITAAPAQVAYGATFPVTTPNGSEIATVSLLRLGSVTHGFDTSQRYLSLTFNPTTGALDVQAPANANMAPPGDYMLFIVDTNGVPSVAAFVRLQ